MKIRFVLILFLISNLFLNAQTTQLKAPIVGKDVVFMENNGLVSVEAEYLNRQSKSNIRQWYFNAKNTSNKISADKDKSHHKNASNNTYLEILTSVTF